MLPSNEKLGMLWHMDIRICTKKEWENSYFTTKNTEFLQSWEWGSFQERAGNRVIRLQFYNNKVFLGQVQAITCSFGRFFRYIYLPRSSKIPLELLPAFKSFCKKHRYIFVRCEGVKVLDCAHESVVSTGNRQPKDTLILSLDEEGDTILSQMHRKTRYNIRLGLRKNLHVAKEKNGDVFWDLHKQTSERDGFGGHGKTYYENMLVSPNITQMTAYAGDTPVASNIFVVYNKVYTYLHGASANQHRNLMAPYVLQWEAIQHAKELGCTEYDFWGVAPKGEVGVSDESLQKFHTLSWKGDHTLSGVTRFKAGFGGKRKTYPQAFDIVCDPVVYKLYKSAKHIKRIIT